MTSTTAPLADAPVVADPKIAELEARLAAAEALCTQQAKDLSAAVAPTAIEAVKEEIARLAASNAAVNARLAELETEHHATVALLEEANALTLNLTEDKARLISALDHANEEGKAMQAQLEALEAAAPPSDALVKTCLQKLHGAIGAVAPREIAASIIKQAGPDLAKALA